MLRWRHRMGIPLGVSTSAFRVQGTPQWSGMDGLFMTAHKAAADMHPVGMNPAVNTLQDPIQQNTATLTHALPVLTDATSFPCLETLTHVETSQPQTGVLRPQKDFRVTWEHLPDFLLWVLPTICYGYTIQFRKGPSPLRGILPTIGSSRETAVLRQEVSSLPRKGAIEEVHPSQTECVCVCVCVHTYTHTFNLYTV